MGNAILDTTQLLIVLVAVHAKPFVPVVIQRLVLVQVASRLHIWQHLDVLLAEPVVLAAMLTVALDAITDTSWTPLRKLVPSAVLTAMSAPVLLLAQLAKLHITSIVEAALLLHQAVELTHCCTFWQVSSSWQLSLVLFAAFVSIVKTAQPLHTTTTTLQVITLMETLATQTPDINLLQLPQPNTDMSTKVSQPRAFSLLRFNKLLSFLRLKLSVSDHKVHMALIPVRIFQAATFKWDK